MQNPSERELTENIISEAKEMILEYQSQIKRPQWKKILLILNFTDCRNIQGYQIL